MRLGGVVAQAVLVVCTGGVAVAQGAPRAPAAQPSTEHPPDRDADPAEIQRDAGTANAKAPPGAAHPETTADAGVAAAASPEPAQPARDCSNTKACKLKGRCTPQDNKCMAGAHTDCEQSVRCRTRGRCTARRGTCVVGSHGSCRASVLCTLHGRCSGRDRTDSAGPACIAHFREDCLRSRGCADSGACSVRAGRCVVASDPDCAHSALCKAKGRCSAEGQVCVAKSDVSCQRSTECQANERCTANQGRCVAMERNSSDTMYLGAVLTVGGVLVLGGGGILAGSSNALGDRVGGLIMFVSGGGMALLGVPLWIVGALPVPAEPATALAPTLTIAPTGGSLRWRF